MTASCLPPPNTAPGSVHVLHHIGGEGWPPSDERRVWTGAVWQFTPNHIAGQASAGATPDSMARAGWRYVGPTKDAAHE